MLGKHPFRMSLMLSIVLMSACSSWGYSSFEKKFAQMTSDERRAFILSHPVENQVNVYVEGMLATRPPDLSLADAIASNGEAVLPFLKERISAEQSEVVKVHLFDVFYRMQRENYYSVIEDSETMNFLVRQASMFRDPEWQRMAQKRLAWIEEVGN